MLELLGYIGYILWLYMDIVFIRIVLDILAQANIINPYNSFISAIMQALHAVTEPCLRPIRRMLPDLGPIDWSPVVLYLIILFIQWVVLSTSKDSFLCTLAGLCRG